MRIRTGVLAALVTAATVAAPTADAAPPPRPQPDTRAGIMLDHLERNPAFGGLRVSLDRQAVEVFVTRRDAGLERAARLAAAGAEVRFTLVRDSYAELNALRGRVHDDDAFLGRHGIDIVSWFTSSSLNTVKLGVVDLTQAKREFLERRYGGPEMVTVVPGARVTEAYSRQDDISPWNGGSVINVRWGTTSKNCSTGPAVRNAFGTEYLLSAGHCYSSSTSQIRETWQEASFRTDDDPTFMGNGSGGRPVNGARGYDVATIRTNTSSLVFATKHPLDQGSGYAQSGTFRAAENTGVCVSGAFSGHWCATYVIDFDGEVENPGGGILIHMNTARRDPQVSTAIVGPGDSGGPVYAVRSDGTRAIAGLIVGHPENAGGWSCANQDWRARGYECSNQVVFHGMGSLQAHLEMTVSSP